MANADTFTFTLATEDFDVSLLPPHARDRSAPAFREAVRAYLQGEFNRFGGWNRIQVGATTIEVSWTPDRQPPDPLEQIIGKLQHGDYGGAITLLQLFLSDRPNDLSILYNLGMALSDLGRLVEAQEHLQRAIELAPDHINARVALGSHCSGKVRLRVPSRPCVPRSTAPRIISGLGGTLARAS
jgi:tetratricopeptide (TPR) repeat protein